LAPLTGFVSAYANTREIAPLVAGVAFATQAGCRYTAQLGSMRISEEIDALESMAIRPLPYFGDNSDDCRLRGHHPAVSDRLGGNYVATQLVLDIGYGSRRAPTCITFTILATDRPLLLHHEGGHFRGHHHIDPLLLRLLCLGGPQGVGAASGAPSAPA